MHFKNIGMRNTLGNYQMTVPSQKHYTLFFFYKNLFYKNVEGDIYEILRTC